MLVKVSTLLEQAESPTLHYVLGGTRTNEYPTAFNYQIQGAGPLPDDCTIEQWNKICDQSAETWYLGKKGATPTEGLPRSTCDDVFKFSGCSGTFNFGCWNFGEIQGDHFIGGHYKVPRYLTDIPVCQDPRDQRYGNHGNPALRFISEGGKHCSVGNEAYGFQDGGHISRCLNARGMISKYDQPSREVKDEKPIHGYLSSYGCDSQIRPHLSTTNQEASAETGQDKSKS